MKIVSVKQNSKVWREWRGKGLGASDAPAVMGDSPWTTPFELWLDKTGLLDKPFANAFAVSAMKRGQDLEPVARKLFEDKVKSQFPAMSAEHEEHQFLRASFDGYNGELNAICEIKCPNKDDHAGAIQGRSPKKYYAQIQQQLLISGCKVCYYVSYDGKESLAVVEVIPNKEYQARLLENLIDFWKRVITLTPPDVTAKDVHKIVKDMQSSLERASKASNVLNILTKE